MKEDNAKGKGKGESEGKGEGTPAGYRRSVGTPRAQARRRELLDLVTADVAEHGLVDFSLRRAAKAAGTTHKVLLYHFDGAEDLLREAVELLRERRLTASMAAALAPGHEQTLAGRIRAVWPVLIASGEGQRALDQALGLAMYDPGRHAALAVDAADRFLPALRGMCPQGWDERRKDEVAELIFAALRGFLVQRRTGGNGDNKDKNNSSGNGSTGNTNIPEGGAGSDTSSATTETSGEPGLAALLRMLDREEAAG